MQTTEKSLTGTLIEREKAQLALLCRLLSGKFEKLHQHFDEQLMVISQSEITHPQTFTH